MSRPAAPVAWPVTLLLPRLADGGGAADDGAGLADTAPDRGDGLLAEAEPLAAGPAGDGAEAVPLPATGWQAARQGRASDGPGHVAPRDGRPRCLSAPLRADTAPDRGAEPLAEQGAGGPKVRKPRGAVTGAPLIRRFFPRLVEFWPKSGD